MEGVVSLRSRERSMGEESGGDGHADEKALSLTYNTQTTVRPDSNVDGSEILSKLVRCTNRRRRSE